MKRHSRPYGCTFPACYKNFGSRNDWKRHENSQHYLQEMWRCNVPNTSGGKCGKVAYDAGIFADHLRRVHVINEREVMSFCERWHLQANAHSCYWCGFCNDLQRQDGTEIQNAMEARYKHIGDHYDKGDFSVEDWVCVETNRAKRCSSRKGRAKRQTRMSRLDDESDLGDDGIPASQVPQENTVMPAWSSPGHPRAQGSYRNKKRKMSVDLDEDAENVSDA